MLSLVCRRNLLRSTQRTVKVIKNNCSNGGGVSDAKAARTARKSRISDVRAAPAYFNPFMSPRVALGGVILAVSGLCVYSIKTDRKGILGSVYWGSAVEITLTEVYNYFLGWMDSISVPYEDKLLPDWPSDPVSSKNKQFLPCEKAVTTSRKCLLNMTVLITHVFHSILCNSSMGERHR